MSNIITVIHNSDQYITVIGCYIPFIVIIERISVSCLVSRDSMTSGDMSQVINHNKGLMISKASHGLTRGSSKLGDIHVLKGHIKLTSLKD